MRQKAWALASTNGSMTPATTDEAAAHPLRHGGSAALAVPALANRRLFQDRRYYTIRTLQGYTLMRHFLASRPITACPQGVRQATLPAVLVSHRRRALCLATRRLRARGPAVTPGRDHSGCTAAPARGKARTNTIGRFPHAHSGQCRRALDAKDPSRHSAHAPTSNACRVRRRVKTARS